MSEFSLNVFPFSCGLFNLKSDVERILSFNEIGLEDPGLYYKKWSELLEYALNCEKEITSKN